jgi:hypothetical protein
MPHRLRALETGEICRARGHETCSDRLLGKPVIRPTPREFRDAFLTVMNDQRANFRTAVHFEPKSYNYFLRADIYPRIARHLGLLSWGREYYTLDGAFYEQRETEHVRPNAAYAKWICVALEHETDVHNSYKEMNKLQLLNVPLKVLITYASEGFETDLLLRNYQRILRAADVYEDFATTRRQLLILGTPKTARDWHFFAYESDGFVQMLPIRE